MAQEKKCEDQNCPAHSSLKTRGRVLTALITSSKMRRTAGCVIERTQELKKYQRQEKRRTRLKVHNPDCVSANAGDTVRIAECRPLSKTKKFVIIEKVKKDASS